MSLYQLLPGVHRRRDAEVGSPLEAYLAVVDEVLDSVQADINRLYDDWFVETCAEWVVPYLGDLLGAPRLRPIEARDASLRAYAANTIAYRRRKGTVAVLEQLAFDVTGWRARAVEYFELLSGTQHLNHLRPDRSGTLDLRDSDELDRLRHGGHGRLGRYRGAFDTAPRTPDLRSVVSRRGTHNIPNVGLWLWRLDAYPLTVPLSADPSGPNRFRISQLTIDTPVFNVPQSETSIETLAEEANVPGPIRLLALQRDLGSAQGDAATRYCGRDRAIELYSGTASIDPETFAAVDLGTWSVDGWDSTDGPILIDPTSSRLMLPERFDPTQIRVRSAYAAAADFGGGPYDRTESTERAAPWHRSIGKSPLIGDPVDHPTLTAALAEWTADAPDIASIEISDSDRYGGAIDISVPADAELTLRAAEGCRPILGAIGSVRLSAPAEARVIIDGLLITGPIEVDGPLTLELRDCTLVPGHSLQTDGAPRHPGLPSIVVADGHDTRLELRRTVSGPIRMPAQPARVEERAPLAIWDSVVQAPRRPGGPIPAIAADDAGTHGAEAAIESSTIAGSVHVTELVASDVIFTGRVAVERTQAGCLRFSYVPRRDSEGTSKTPRRYRCEPDTTITFETELAGARASAEGSSLGPVAVAALEDRLIRSVVPTFVSSAYGDPGYMQLADLTPVAIRTGGEGGTEMGALAQAKAPIRIENLRRALDHYARYGTEVGALHQT